MPEADSPTDTLEPLTYAQYRLLWTACRDHLIDVANQGTMTITEKVEQDLAFLGFRPPTVDEIHEELGEGLFVQTKVVGFSGVGGKP
jgi:hypothetical protein